ncbi:muscarinic acetylcholine receptor M2-like [Hemiscyllium ocellatum]|uniref:muscarinic acetylcholine receptor M2-like n=1 Tax=Hemiscyllium ocellatum TaxID=170820 RepID=UPI002966F788|nr:muscarinic acetylcholine receptor M2-like [Hemiscyllium ocellatum]
MFNISTNVFLTNITNFLETQRGTSYKKVEVIFIVVMTGSINLLTIIGNILVIISIKTNRQLRTINNYFIFSLSCADLILGVFTMNVFTIYTALGYWPMGPVFCDVWLVVDYVVNNASGMNLLLISFDRFFCVTKPLSYPVRRTPKIAGIMIATAWGVSFFLWAPAIVFWQFIVGERTVPEDECYPQLFSSPAITLMIVIAVFYLPVTILVTLYVRISCASKSRIKWARNEPEQSKRFCYPSPYKINEAKPIANNIPNICAGSLHAQSQNKKVKAGMPTDKAEQVEKEVFTEKKYPCFETLNQKMEGAIHDGVSFSNTQSQVVMNRIKLASMKIVGVSPNCQFTGTMAGLETGGGNMEPDFRDDRSNGTMIKMIKVATNMKKVAGHRDKTVTRTILAIILAFVITWSPYFVMVIITAFCPSCITHTIWNIGNWIVYMNSTINPACYALCNVTFKKTFKHLLFCQYKNIGTR